eukprot:CAMPEP_0179186606 /NCGR_PEP_ID=MMETSP0796-20121207/92562_1 /TAXON_ID=73915 /ORGANISM="Pyrodinium bahamense, Strain pbaha01" /LENGTH=343 /DNA_ID=CAMNT_0020890613 /DNA_START=71 /DNA_END=1103 /DNA_ORIENTATION=+
MDAVSLFGSANTLYVNEDYEEALKHYTCAVTLQDCAEYRSCRSAAYLKLGKFKEAVEDADEALKFDGKSHMAFHWKGIALFYLGDVAGAKAAFEATAVTGAAPRPAPVEQKPTEEDAATATKAPPTSEPTVTSKEGLSISGRKQIKREWYQNGTHVFVTIFAKNVPQDACKVDFKERELSLAFPLPGATEEEYQMDIELFDAVEPAQCKYEVSKVKVELSLVKKNAGCQWRDLEKCQEIVYTPDQPAYPTSNKQKRDWSQIDRDIDSELKNEKPAGDEALNKLFKEIYDRADDDTRRAMNKSFQTSGGTVLSTNWGEVARSDYEGKDRPTPPEGQEWRDWKNK